MAAVKLPDPPPSGGKPDERLRRLESYCAQLNEQLTYILSNLDDRNFTPTPTEGGTP